MPRLSYFLTSALNSNSINQNRVEHLIDRWELALCDIGETRGWYDQDETVYLSQHGGTAHMDETFSCEHCDNLELNSCSRDVRTYSRHSGRLVEQLWCDDCRDNHTFCCARCDETFHDEYSNEVDNEYYCPNCFEEAEANADIPSYHSQSRPRCPYPKETERIYSVELELESPNRAAFCESLKDANLERTIWEKDGSLDDEQGIEVIISYQNDIGVLIDMLKTVSKLAYKTNAKSWATNRCGVHINSNRCKAWTPSATMRLLWLVKRHSNLLKIISGRETHFASWDRLPRLADWQKGYCDKYTCVRVGSDRFEWRMFKGTLNPARLECYVRAVRLMEDYALAFNIGSLIRLHSEINIGLTLLAQDANDNGAKIKI